MWSSAFGISQSLIYLSSSRVGNKLVENVPRPSVSGVVWFIPTPVPPRDVFCTHFNHRLDGIDPESLIGQSLVYRVRVFVGRTLVLI